MLPVLNKTVKICRLATQTNEIQLSAVLLLTSFNLAAMVSRPDAPLVIWVGVLLMWPVFAFIGNCIHPIPNNNTEDT